MIEKPHILTIAETKTNILPPIPDYTWISKHKPGQKGGVAIAARNDIKNKVKDSRDNDIVLKDIEITWVTITDKYNKSMHIGAYYGKQEGHNVEETQREYDEITTQIINRKHTGDVVLTGDFNAKIEIKENNGKIKQNQSRNGKMLQHTLDMTKLIPASTTECSPKWTRINRNNTSEKSIIDYALISDTMKKRIKEVYVDEEGIMKIEGKNQSDHNPIMITLDYNTMKTKEKVTKWKLNNNNKWKEYNKEIQKIYENGTTENYENLHEAIHLSLTNTIGKTTYTRSNKPHIPKDIKPLAQRRKEIKKTFNTECKRNGPDKANLLEEIKTITTLINTRINEKRNNKVKETTMKIIKNGGVNSKMFWNLRKQILKTDPNPNHDTIDEEDHIIKDKETAKEHIANYYENLYKAREPREEFAEHSKEIEADNTRIENYLKSTTQPIPITMKELNEAIKKIKRGKATGPDDIPNEAILNADYKTRRIICDTFNNIIQAAEIPKKWQESVVTRFYKGKGKRGKCSSERGITLSSNIGKLFERIINKRIQDNIQITDEQGGGRPKRSTADHINILNTIIDNNKKNKKPTLITFLDVTKAYDKAWIEAIMNVLYKQGIKDSTWLICKEINKNLTARIMTQYGRTREIKIRDSIRQGGVLSVIMYALLMDEISKETKKENIGTEIWNEGQRINTLLWMDDVALITDNEKDMKTLLKITEEIAGKYRIEFGQEKSKFMLINPTRKKVQIDEMKIQGMTIQRTENYRYLGYTLNSKNNLKTHLSDLKKKTEGAYQTILAIMGNQNFSNMEMETAWKLIKTCLIPIITYAGETWHPTKQESKEINQLLDNILKRLLMTPQSTPREALYLETGLIDCMTQINMNRLNAYNRLIREHNNLMKNLIQSDSPTKWKTETDKILQSVNIDPNELITTSKHKARNQINMNTRKKFLEDLKTTGANKTKIKNMLDYSEYTTLSHKEYIFKLNRLEASTIFKTKCRMLDVKNNYKNKYRDNLCRKCGNSEETQEHILQECIEIHTTNELITEPDEIYGISITLARNAAHKIQKIMDKLQT